jgi:hypothetical protein
MIAPAIAEGRASEVKMTKEIGVNIEKCPPNVNESRMQLKKGAALFSMSENYRGRICIDTGNHTEVTEECVIVTAFPRVDFQNRIG